MEQKARRVYAKIEHRHLDDGQGFRLVFQSIDADWFDEANLRSRPRSLEGFHQARVFIIQITQEGLERAARDSLKTKAMHQPSVAASGAMIHILRSIDGDLDARWFVMTFSGPYVHSSGAIRARVFENLGGAGWTQRIEHIAVADEVTQRYLNAVFQLPGSAEDEMSDVWRAIEQISDPHVVAYDVGQGSANGLHHAHGWVQCYFDLGGGVHGHAKTYPAGLRFCFSKRPLIILSHWHFDHWVSATFNVAALTSDWLVPEQSIGPFHLALALAIWSEGGRVIVWPKTSRGVVTRGAISVGLCSGSNRNESGLAVLVKTYAGEVLLPGDCGYGHLPDFWPGLSSVPLLQGLVVPHHGGKTSALTTKVIPQPRSAWAKLAYSYGHPSGRYRHPHKSVEAEHAAAGWSLTMTRKTPAMRPRQGHVWLTPSPFTPPCYGSGGLCTLRPAQ